MPAAALAPNRPVPAADTGRNVIPAFLPHPVTGKDASYPADAKVAAKDRLLPALTAKAAAPSGNERARIAEAERKLAVAEGATTAR